MQAMCCAVLAAVAMVMCVPVPLVGAVPDALMFRLFLNEGRTLVSYGDYTRTPDFVVFAMPVLGGIRYLEEPATGALSHWGNELAGGAGLLERQPPPAGTADTHGKLVSAWPLTEDALRSWQSAIVSINSTLVDEASSGAAGAWLLIATAQREDRAFAEGQSSQ
jgi:hypothetical protein